MEDLFPITSDKEPAPVQAEAPVMPVVEPMPIKKSKSRQKDTVQGYIYQLNRRMRVVHGQRGDELVDRLHDTITATAQCQLVLKRLSDELDQQPLVMIETGSQGQMKKVVNPLLPVYEKYLARLSGLLYELGLSNRKGVVKADEQDTSVSPMQEMLAAMNN